MSENALVAMNFKIDIYNNLLAYVKEDILKKIIIAFVINIFVNFYYFIECSSNCKACILIPE